MRRFLWIVLFALSAAALPAAAGAQRLTIDDVRNMALDRGVVTIKEIELDHGVWEVQGRDAGGHKIEMKVDALSGEIVKMRRTTEFRHGVKSAGRVYPHAVMPQS